MRRQHSIAEARNIVVGHMKRNDSFTRRFIQYCTMRAGEILILVRDGKTGKIVTAPEKDHMWTYREKNGLGRASKNNWDKILEVGHDYFMAVDSKIAGWPALFYHTYTHTTPSPSILFLSCYSSLAGFKPNLLALRYSVTIE